MILWKDLEREDSLIFEKNNNNNSNQNFQGEYRLFSSQLTLISRFFSRPETFLEGGKLQQSRKTRAPRVRPGSSIVRRSSDDSILSLSLSPSPSLTSSQRWVSRLARSESRSSFLTKRRCVIPWGFSLVETHVVDSLANEMFA